MATKAEVLAVAFSFISDSYQEEQERFVAIYRNIATQVKKETVNYCKHEYWLLDDSSVVRIDDADNRFYGLTFGVVDTTTAAGKRCKEELIQLANE